MNTARNLLLITLGLIAGCASGPQEPTEAQKQDAILQDPMGYKPQVGGNVSGGDITNFDRSGFNHDLNDVLNP